LLAPYPRSPTLLTQYCAIAARRQDWAEALRRAEIFVVRAPGAPWGWLFRVSALRQLGRPDEALDLLRQAVRRLPRDPEILIVWARQALEEKDRGEALRRFEKVRRVAPLRAEGYQEAVDVLAEDGRAEAAEALIAEGLRRLSGNWVMWQAAARLAERLARQEEAIARWEALRAAFPGEPAGYLHGSEALARAGRNEKAIAPIREAHDYFPGNKDISEAAARSIPV
jgi:predicted Zn-dependent protease